MGTIRDDMLAAVPSLRAYARSLAHNIDDADDLVQDTLVRAISRIDTFEPGTNLNAWLFTILRNKFYSTWRKRAREFEDPDGLHAASLSWHGEQEGHLDFQDFLRAFAALNVDQREALMLVASMGLSFEEAAEIMGVAVGTAKSRVIRARARLARALFPDGNTTIGPDQRTLAAIHT